MNILLPISACAFLLSAHPSMSAEEKSISPSSDQAITIPDSLDGYTLTMTSKELKYVHISFYTQALDNGAIVRNGGIETTTKNIKNVYHILPIPPTMPRSYFPKANGQGGKIQKVIFVKK